MKRLAIRRTIQCLVDYWLTLLTDLYQFTAPQGWRIPFLRFFLVFFCFLNFIFCKALLDVAYLRCRQYVRNPTAKSNSALIKLLI